MAKNIERDRQPGCQWRKRFRYLYPDPKLGSAIVAKARGYDMKVLPWMTSLLTPKVSQWIPFRCDDGGD